MSLRVELHDGGVLVWSGMLDVIPSKGAWVVFDGSCGPVKIKKVTWHLHEDKNAYVVLKCNSED